MTESPYVGVVVDLVDPYFTTEVKNIGGFKSTSAAGNMAIWWMRRHPGRWALVGEGTTGLTRELLKACPDLQVTETGTVTNSDLVRRTYARLPHPQGESIKAALNRRPVAPHLYLPEVTKDPFGWSKAELAEACQIARDNLFPVSS